MFFIGSLSLLALASSARRGDRTTLSNHYPPIRRVSSSHISWRVAHFQVLRPTIYLIKGGLICQQNIGTATLRWGGTL
jgi:hypothetical protein